MKCVIPGANCKILGRAIHALSKISEEMYVEPREKSLSFRSVSPTNSAYCDFTFEDIYFSSYTSGNLEEEDALKCKISMKSALTVFKSLPAIEKLVETCHIRLEPNADQLIFIFKFKNSVIKTFFLPIIDCEQLSGPFTKDDSPNRLSAKSRVLMDVVQNFQQSLAEITLEVTPQKLLMRNYVDETSKSWRNWEENLIRVIRSIAMRTRDHSEDCCTLLQQTSDCMRGRSDPRPFFRSLYLAVANSTRTQLAITIGEFDEYKIGVEAQITFCLKEFKAILNFADAVSLSLNVYFETTGKPVFFDLNCPTFQANLVLSTLNPDGDDVSAVPQREIGKSLRKRTATKKTPRQAAKVSKKRPTNRTNSTKISANVGTNMTTDDRLNPLDPSNRMDVDDNESTASNISDEFLYNANLGKVQTDPMSKDSDDFRECSAAREILSTCREASTSRHFSPVISSIDPMSDGQTEPSIFSPTWKKQTEKSKNDNLDLAMEEDEIPGSPSPPLKRAKLIFKKCFQSTFDPRMLPGHDSILADDSDEEN